MPWVKIKKGLTHRSGTLKGGEVVEVSEAEVVSFGDKFELLDNEEPVVPTDAAVAYAKEHDLDLSKVQGTGKDGRITLPDVRTALQVENSLLEDIEVELAVTWSEEDGNP